MFWKEAVLNQRVRFRAHSIPNLLSTTSQSATPDGLLRFRSVCTRMSPETPGFEETFVFTSFLPFVNGTTASRSQRNTTLIFPFLSQIFRSRSCSGIIIIIIIIIIISHISHRGHAVAHLVEALRYKSEGRGFDSRWCHWHNPSGRIMVLGLTQPLTEMSTRSISWGAKAAGA